MHPHTFIKVGDKFINAGLIACAERQSTGRVVVHFAVPRGELHDVSRGAGGASSFGVTDHFILELTGTDAEDLFRVLEGLRRQ